MPMSYRLQKKENLAEGVKRLALEEIDKALSYLEAPQEEMLDEAVHESRKCFKKLRGLLRLVRKEMGEPVYQRENVCFRDAGRHLSELRDSAVYIQTLDSVLDDDAFPLTPDVANGMREALVIFYHATRQRTVEEEQGVVKAVDMIRAARHRVPGWPIEEDSFSAVSGGLHKVYKRGRNRLEDAQAAPSAEAFHEWRKRVKYLWYSVRLLRPIWPGLMSCLADEIHDLSDDLGEAHDLAELQKLVAKRPLILEDEEQRQRFLTFLEAQRTKLHAAAYQQGQCIYAEPPKKFLKRLNAYWQVNLA